MMKIITRERVILLIILSVFAILIWIFVALASAVGFFAALAIYLLTIFALIRIIIQGLVFPGSIWLFRRSVETHFSQEMASQVLRKVKDLKLSIEILLEKTNESDKVKFLMRAFDATQEARSMLTSIIYTYTKQKTYNTLTPRQDTLLSQLEGLKDSLENTKVRVETEETNLWDWLDSSYFEDSEWPNTHFDTKNNHKAAKIVEHCKSIESQLSVICNPTNCLQRLKRLLTDTTFGTVDFMRVELENRFGGERVWIDTQDGKKVDGMFIPAAYPPDVQESPNTVPTIIFCNPNAGYYEYMYFQNEWLDYYLNNGINTFIWNYRGYGRSEGYPSPVLLKQDAESIVEYLKTTRQLEKIGAHGESMGGAVATHIANKHQLDFLFADRTFADLSDVAKYTVGSFAKKGLKWLTCWIMESTNDYLEAPSYKVLGCDPADAVINDLASLKSGIAKYLVEEIKREAEFGGGESCITPRDTLQNLNITENDSRDLIAHPATIPRAQSIENYYHILSKGDTIVFYKSLQALTQYIIDLVKKGGIPSEKEPKKKSSSFNLDSSRTLESPKHQKSNSANTSLNFSSIGQKNMSLDEIELSEVSPSKNKYALLDAKNISAEENEVLNEVLLRVYAIFDSIDAGGKTLNQVFEAPKRIRLEQLKTFLINLDIWGSYLPFSVLSSWDSQTTRANTLVQINVCRREIRKLICENTDYKSALFMDVIKHLKVVENYLTTIGDAFNQRKDLVDDITHIGSSNMKMLPLSEEEVKKFEAKNPMRSNSENMGDVIVETNESEYSNDSARKTQTEMVDERDASDQLKIEIPENDSSLLANDTVMSIDKNYLYPEAGNGETGGHPASRIGYLIPLMCGHNGTYNSTEKAIYEDHLSRAGFLQGPQC